MSGDKFPLHGIPNQTPMKSILSLIALCLVLVSHAAWPEEVSLSLDGQTIHAEIADTPESREQGLMHREQLCANCAMLFIFDHPYKYSFWMKDTPLPLSIAFIAADGSIINIEEMLPNTTDIHDAQGQALYALEMNRGWFAGNGVKPRDRVQGLGTLPRARH